MNKQISCLVDIGVAYQQIVDFKVPSDAGDIDASFSGVPVDSVVLNNVSNLPPGISYACNAIMYLVRRLSGLCNY